MTHVTDNREARKRKFYADVVKASQTQPLVSENKSNEKNEKLTKRTVRIKLVLKKQNLC